MTNREQVAWSLVLRLRDGAIAQIVSDMLDAAGAAYLDSADRARFERWLGLHCDPETNNWGVLPEDGNK